MLVYTESVCLGLLKSVSYDVSTGLSITACTEYGVFWLYSSMNVVFRSIHLLYEKGAALNLRKFEHEDRAHLVELWRAVFPDDPPHNEPGKVISEKLKVDDLIFVVEHEKQIIGACIAGYDGHRGWLYAVAVSPSSRRGGVGSKLIKHTLAHLKSLGCEKINIQIRSTNTKVESFYKSLGFIAEDRLSMGVFIE